MGFGSLPGPAPIHSGPSTDGGLSDAHEIKRGGPHIRALGHPSPPEASLTEE